MNKKGTPPRYPCLLHPLSLDTSIKEEENYDSVKPKPKCSIFSKTNLSAPRNPFQAGFIPQNNPILDPTEGAVGSLYFKSVPHSELITPSSPKSFSFSSPPSPDISASSSCDSIYSYTPHPHPPISPLSAGSTPSSTFRYRKYVSKSATSLTGRDKSK